jgi:hypothetical protein
MNLVCKYCRNELSTEVKFIVSGKITKELICMTCLIDYMEKYHHLGNTKNYLD